MPEFDMFTKQNVSIDYNVQSKEYRVLITTQNSILMYEVWNSKKIINKRTATELSLAQFVDLINIYNSTHAIKYTPTTIVDFGSSLHVLILTRAELDECGNVFFYLKKNSVVFTNKLEKINSELPFGNYKNVRFDIDPSPTLTSPGRANDDGPTPDR